MTNKTKKNRRIERLFVLLMVVLVALLTQLIFTPIGGLIDHPERPLLLCANTFILIILIIAISLQADKED